MTRLRARRTHATLAMASVVLQLGCGSSDETHVAQDEPPEDTSVQVTEKVNICPHFEGSLVLPQTIPLGTQAIIVVRAVDPDGDDSTLSYEFSASSGEMSDTVGPSTKYSCTEPGPQILTVVTKDAHGCHAKLEINVTCLDR